MEDGDYIMYSRGLFYAVQIRDIEYQVAVAAHPYVNIVNYLDSPLWRSGERPPVLEIKPRHAMSDRPI